VVPTRFKLVPSRFSWAGYGCIIQPRTTSIRRHCIAVDSENLATIHPGWILTQLLGEVIFHISPVDLVYKATRTKFFSAAANTHAREL
jgi:hypothetical protein